MNKRQFIIIVYLVLRCLYYDIFCVYIHYILINDEFSADCGQENITRVTKDNANKIAIEAGFDIKLAALV
jgi:hypothetical protein